MPVRKAGWRKPPAPYVPLDEAEACVCSLGPGFAKDAHRMAWEHSADGVAHALLGQFDGKK